MIFWFRPFEFFSKQQKYHFRNERRICSCLWKWKGSNPMTYRSDKWCQNLNKWNVYDLIQVLIRTRWNHICKCMLCIIWLQTMFKEKFCDKYAGEVQKFYHIQNKIPSHDTQTSKRILKSPPSQNKVLLDHKYRNERNGKCVVYCCIIQSCSEHRMVSNMTLPRVRRRPFPISLC